MGLRLLAVQSLESDLVTDTAARSKYLTEIGATQKTLKAAQELDNLQSQVILFAHVMRWNRNSWN
jgi:hypothetical protein